MIRPVPFLYRLVVPLLAALLWVQPGLVHAAGVDLTTRAQGSEQPGQGTGAASATAAQESSVAVGSLEDARSAVVQIEAVGTFVDPAEGLIANAAGAGTGFIIDESGIAVTNNHVVTGGALFRVYVDGHARPLNARVLGVSECADLAVIDIQGAGFPFLAWYEGPVRVGLDVYAAGFPLGDPEYTLTRGIVAKARAGGDTSWASMDQVLQHDADLNPGNSGGPLLTADGQVVGVNYRMNDARQYFAIARDEALPIIEQLRRGVDVDSLGINGEAVTGDGGLSGIWVASVQSGSPADVSGVQAGDILLSLEGVTLAEDGTMATYCDILRSHDPTDVLAMEVLRFDTEEVLEGQINGRPLQRSFSIADALAADGQNSAPAQTGAPDQASSPSQTDDPPATYAEYVTISDEQGIIVVDVPAEWGDVVDEVWTVDDKAAGIHLYATPDLDAFAGTWGTPGLLFGYSDVLAADYTPDELLDGIDYGTSCTYSGRTELPDDGPFTGVYDLWEECGEDDATGLIVSAVPEGGDYILLIEVYAVSDADAEAVDRILNSFIITPLGSEEVVESGETGESVVSSIDAIDTRDLAYEYAVVEDPALTALLPANWSDTASEDWLLDDEKIGVSFTASSSLRRFNRTWTTPGVAVYTLESVNDDFQAVDGLDAADMSDSCEYADRFPHRHTVAGVTYAGAFDVWHNCDGEENSYIVLSALSEPRDHGVFVYFLAVDEADREAFDVLARSFYVVTPATEPIIAAASAEVQQAAVEYVTLIDEAGAASVRVPTTWSDVVNEDWELDGDVVGRSLTAAPDVQEFNDTWTTPGAFIGVSEAFGAVYTPEEALDFFDMSDECTYDDRYSYESDVLAGVYDIWFECDGIAEQRMAMVAAEPAASAAAAMALLLINLPTAADVDVFSEILDSLVIGSEQPAGDEAPPTAVVEVDRLNIRSGPGTSYRRTGVVSQGETLAVVGQVDACSWLSIVTADGRQGWVSGSSQ